MSIDKNGMIKAPVDPRDVATVLNEKSLDIGALCVSKRINPFAMFKPMDAPVMLNPMDRLYDYPRWICQYGITPKRVLSYSLLPELFDGDMNGWEYARPKGWYRITDFVSQDGSLGYDHNAQPFSWQADSTSIIEGQNIRFVFAYPRIGATDATGMPTGMTEVTFDMIDGVKDCKVGIMLVLQTNGTVRIKTFEGSLTRVITFEGSLLSRGNWKAYPFLTTATLTDGYPKDNTIGIFYPIPRVSPIDFNVIALNNAYTIGATMGLDAMGIRTLTITFRNNTDEIIRIYDSVWTLRFSTNLLDTPMEEGEMAGELVESSMLPHDTFTYTIQSQRFSEMIRGRDYTVYVQFKLSIANITFTRDIDLKINWEDF